MRALDSLPGRFKDHNISLEMLLDNQVSAHQLTRDPDRQRTLLECFTGQLVNCKIKFRELTIKTERVATSLYINKLMQRVNKLTLIDTSLQLPDRLKQAFCVSKRIPNDCTEQL
jgi:hypothetical protein